MSISKTKPCLNAAQRDRFFRRFALLHKKARKIVQDRRFELWPYKEVNSK